MGSRAAWNAQVRYGANIVLAYEWQCETDAGLWDDTNFEDAGFEFSKAGVHKARYTVRGFWDADNNLHLDPPFLVDGHEEVVQLYTTGVAVGDCFNFNPGIIERVKIFAQVRDGLKMDFDGRNQGEFFYPGGISPNPQLV